MPVEPVGSRMPPLPWMQSDPRTKTLTFRMPFPANEFPPPSVTQSDAGSPRKNPYR